MIFTQQVNFNNMAVDKEFEKICRVHHECKDCPLKEKDMNIQGTMVQCITGREKRG